MPITGIKREFNLAPNIVGILTTDTLIQITTPGYFGSQFPYIEALTNGSWIWLPTDVVLIAEASGGHFGFFEYDITTDTFIAIADGQTPLPNGEIFVGNVSNIATAVPMSGDTTINNTGATTVHSIGGHSVTLGGSFSTQNPVSFVGADLLTVNLTGPTNISLPLAGTLLNNQLNAGEIYLGNVGNTAQPVTMTGAVTIDDTGVTTIANNAVGYNQLGMDIIQQVSVTLTSADIQNMFGAPISFLPAPGANQIIVVYDVLFDFNFGTTQYTGGGSVYLQFGNAPMGAGAPATGPLPNSFINNATQSMVFQSGGQIEDIKTACVDQPLYLSNDTAAFATGDSTITVYVQYRITTLA